MKIKTRWIAFCLALVFFASPLFGVPFDFAFAAAPKTYEFYVSQDGKAGGAATSAATAENSIGRVYLNQISKLSLAPEDKVVIYVIGEVNACVLTNGQAFPDIRTTNATVDHLVTIEGLSTGNYPTPVLYWDSSTALSSACRKSGSPADLYYKNLTIQPRGSNNTTFLFTNGIGSVTYDNVTFAKNLRAEDGGAEITWRVYTDAATPTAYYKSPEFCSLPAGELGVHNVSTTFKNGDYSHLEVAAAGQYERVSGTMNKDFANGSPAAASRVDKTVTCDDGVKRRYTVNLSLTIGEGAQMGEVSAVNWNYAYGKIRVNVEKNAESVAELFAFGPSAVRFSYSSPEISLTVADSSKVSSLACYAPRSDYDGLTKIDAAKISADASFEIDGVRVKNDGKIHHFYVCETAGYTTPAALGLPESTKVYSSFDTLIDTAANLHDLIAVGDVGVIHLYGTVTEGSAGQALFFTQSYLGKSFYLVGEELTVENEPVPAALYLRNTTVKDSATSTTRRVAMNSFYFKDLVIGVNAANSTFAALPMSIGTMEEMTFDGCSFDQTELNYGASVDWHLYADGIASGTFLSLYIGTADAPETHQSSLTLLRGDYSNLSTLAAGGMLPVANRPASSTGVFPLTNYSDVGGTKKYLNLTASLIVGEGAIVGDVFGQTATVRFPRNCLYRLRVEVLDGATVGAVYGTAKDYQITGYCDVSLSVSPNAKTPSGKSVPVSYYGGSNTAETYRYGSVSIGEAAKPLGAALSLSERVGVMVLFDPQSIARADQDFLIAVYFGENKVKEIGLSDLVNYTDPSDQKQYKAAFLEGCAPAEFDDADFTLVGRGIETKSFSLNDLIVSAGETWRDEWVLVADSLINLSQIASGQTPSYVIEADHPDPEITTVEKLEGFTSGIISGYALSIADAIGIRVQVSSDATVTANGRELTEKNSRITVSGETKTVLFFVSAQNLDKPYVIEATSVKGRAAFRASVKDIANIYVNKKTEASLATAILAYAEAIEATKSAADETPFAIPSGFSAGYSRVNISPRLFPILMNSTSLATYNAHPIYASVVAIADGENVAMMIHLDLKRVSADLRSKSIQVISAETGIPEQFISLTATHTHNGPEVNYIATKTETAKWFNNVYLPRIRQAVREAYRDLSPATMYGGTADTTGYNFARRYFCADGTFTGIHMATVTGKATSYETQADSTLQTLHFKRAAADKKDIVMVNWQAHVAHAASTYADGITSDFVHYLRAGVEEKYSVHFAYYNGACGNLNLTEKISGTRSPDVTAAKGDSIWEQVGNALVNKVGEAMRGEARLQTGTIKASMESYTATVRTDDPERVAQAKEYSSAAAADKEAILEKYAFNSRYEASNIVSRSKSAGKEELLPLQTIVCGEFAFAGASFEMFDVNGMEIKAESPYRMTFVCGCTNGSNGYIPSYECFSNGGYETHCSRYLQGTGEGCRDLLLDMLASLK